MTSLMSAHIDVVETAATDPHGFLDGVVLTALSARMAIGLLGSGLVLLSLAASLVG
jgi:hypothetical protein